MTERGRVGWGQSLMIVSILRKSREERAHCMFSHSRAGELDFHFSTCSQFSASIHFFNFHFLLMGGASIIPTACFICLLFISPIYVLCVAGSHFRNKRKRRPRYAYLFSLAFSSSIVLMQDKYFSSLSPPGVRGRRQHETLGLRGRDEVQGG